MSIVFKLNGALLPYQSVRLTGDGGGVAGLPSSAWYGEPMTAGIQIEDPTGALTLDGWSVFTVDESACTGKTRIFTGWITGKVISRGKYRNGAGRVWDCDIIDQNAALGFQVFRSGTAKRPAETDLARITYMLGSGKLGNTPVVSGTRTNLTDNPISQNEADFVGQYPIEMATSAVVEAGKIFYVFWNQSTARLELFYDQPSAFPAATISISNVLADVTSESGGTVFAPFIDATMERDPSMLYTGELFHFRGGYAFGERQGTIDALSPTPLSPSTFRRERVVNSDRVGSLTTANAAIASGLEQLAVEADTIRVTIQVPASRVNHVDAGERMTVRFSHLPGYETATSVNVIRRDVVPTAGMDNMYDIHLELSNRVKIREVNGGPPGDFPPVAQCNVANVAIVQNTHAACNLPSPGVLTGATWSSAPTAGNLLICMWRATYDAAGAPHAIGTMDGWTQIGDGETMLGTGGTGGTVLMFWKIASSSESSTVQATGGAISGPSASASNCYLLEVSGVDALDTYVEGTANNTTNLPVGFSVTPTSGKVAFIATLMAYNTNLGGPATPVAGSTELYEEGNINGGGNPITVIDYRIVASTTGSYNVNSTLAGTPYWISTEGVFYCSGADLACPASGQWVDWAFLANGDGSTTTFTVPCPYADKGLLVQVDGVPVTLGLTETNPAAGTFTLDFAPKAAQGDAPAEQVWIRYQGR